MDKKTQEELLENLYQKFEIINENFKNIENRLKKLEKL